MEIEVFKLDNTGICVYIHHSTKVFFLILITSLFVQLVWIPVNSSRANFDDSPILRFHIHKYTPTHPIVYNARKRPTTLLRKFESVIG